MRLNGYSDNSIFVTVSWPMALAQSLSVLVKGPLNPSGPIPVGRNTAELKADIKKVLHMMGTGRWDGGQGRDFFETFPKSLTVISISV